MTYTNYKLKRPLILGGVQIAHEKGLLGHSDADVALHALMDSLLGAAGLPDIGNQFPDTDSQFKDASSLMLLKDVYKKIQDMGLSVENMDVTIVAEAPKISPHRDKMITTIAEALDLPPHFINIKASTNEGLGFEGRKEGITAYAISTLKG